jgi:hypothetical protein
VLQLHTRRGGHYTLTFKNSLHINGTSEHEKSRILWKIY